MAIAPPPYGLPPVDELPPTSPDERMASINKHFYHLFDFSRALVDVTRASHLAAGEAVAARNVDSEPTMTAEQYDEVMEVLGGIMPKLLDINADVRRVGIILLRVTGRELPSHLQR